MPRATTIFAGITLATLITYQSRINLVTHTANVQRHLDEAKENADLITNRADDPLVRLSLQRPTSSVEQFIDNTKSYYKGRLVPSGKNMVIFFFFFFLYWVYCITLVIKS